MRYLAIDWGTVRVGAAISDPDGKIAFPLNHVLDTKTAVDEIKQIIAEQTVEKVLIGLPTNLQSESTESTDKTLRFVEKLKKEIHISIETLDERFSSVAAGKVLSAGGMKEKDQREIKDNVAAQLMLQQYLDSNN